MTLQRLGLTFLGVLAGGLLGGFAHTLLLDHAATVALERSGLDPLYFGVKPIGESLAVLFVLYAFPLCIVLFMLLVYGFARVIAAVQRWRGGFRGQPTSSRLLARSLFMIGALLGAVGTGLWNLRVMTDEYASAIAYNDRYAVATASAVPDMRSRTAMYCGILLVLLVAIPLFHGIRQMYRVGTRLAS